MILDLRVEKIDPHTSIGELTKLNVTRRIAGERRELFAYLVHRLFELLPRLLVAVADDFHDLTYETIEIAYRRVDLRGEIEIEL